MTDDQIRLVHARWQGLVDKCMESTGFPEYLPITLPAGPFTDPPIDSRDRAKVAVDGFTFVSPSFELSQTEADLTEVAANDPAFRVALQGSDDGPANGCAPRTFVVIYGPNSELAATAAELANLDSEVLMSVHALQRYSDLDSEWADCMNKKGFAYASREALANVAWAEPRPTIQEIDAALADFDCRGSVQYPTRYTSMYEAEHERIAEEKAATITELASTIRKFLKKAVGSA